ncbi:SMI1/KNR4 family protein [Deinococcus deserti]|uniref:Knr4/Smi1-like domain-containing protein n=1 Tax=Deinococcus deserti (strain DSM 17065 / CIP 109153 / LMG 22923 / VCD115) TaxID=546414 RepID=C1D4A4_DEIDV|nr:SMI1/KNR4 family protein [Deinococcus deserti]ACO47985.1 Conserved hypothetical protein; ISDds6 passenger product [Deinococcus deserti VCD115]
MGQEELFKRLRAGGVPAPLIPKLPDDREIDALEVLLETRLPPSYRAYLLTLSDVLAGAYWPLVIHHELTGGRLLDQTRDLRAIGLPQFLVPFETSQDGDAFCFDTRSAGPEYAVVRWVHDDGSFDTYRWPSFIAWVQDEWLPTVEDQK